jgi:hypothetical protein
LAELSVGDRVGPSRRARMSAEMTPEFGKSNYTADDVEVLEMSLLEKIVNAMEAAVEDDTSVVDDEVEEVSLLGESVNGDVGVVDVADLDDVKFISSMSKLSAANRSEVKNAERKSPSIIDENNEGSSKLVLSNVDLRDQGKRLYAVTLKYYILIIIIMWMMILNLSFLYIYFFDDAEAAM